MAIIRKNKNKLTAVEFKLYKKLEDGRPHLMTDLLLEIDDEGYADIRTLQVHMVHLRRKLRVRGLMVTFLRIHGGSAYQLGRNLEDAHSGRH